jgi:hypothetical protein
MVVDQALHNVPRRLVPGGKVQRQPHAGSVVRLLQGLGVQLHNALDDGRWRLAVDGVVQGQPATRTLPCCCCRRPWFEPTGGRSAASGAARGPGPSAGAPTPARAPCYCRTDDARHLLPDLPARTSAARQGNIVVRRRRGSGSSEEDGSDRIRPPQGAPRERTGKGDARAGRLRPGNNRPERIPFRTRRRKGKLLIRQQLPFLFWPGRWPLLRLQPAPPACAEREAGGGGGGGAWRKREERAGSLHGVLR